MEKIQKKYSRTRGKMNFEVIPNNPTPEEIEFGKFTEHLLNYRHKIIKREIKKIINLDYS
jgi:hypothetical protein